MSSTISTPVTARLHHEDVAALNRIVDHTPRTTVSSLIAAYVRDGLRRDTNSARALTPGDQGA